MVYTSVIRELRQDVSPWDWEAAQTAGSVSAVDVAHSRRRSWGFGERRSVRCARFAKDVQVYPYTVSDVCIYCAGPIRSSAWASW